MQRISAANLNAKDAELLGVSPGVAGLRIERISYLPSGKVVEFTRSLITGSFRLPGQVSVPRRSHRHRRDRAPGRRHMAAGCRCSAWSCCWRPRFWRPRRRRFTTAAPARPMPRRRPPRPPPPPPRAQN
ncbi:UTRA domain-containing protein [Paracoccus sp. APAP_BH8]|uniref:UTRA domain-containing protein n=1 Tax=Paracoccus sp. APAP_BH8 TaxID=3110237 RepID=UPI003FA7893F